MQVRQIPITYYLLNMPTQTMAQYTEAEKCAHISKACEMVKYGAMCGIDSKVFIAVYRGVPFILTYSILYEEDILFKRGEWWISWWDTTNPYYTPDSPKPFSDISRTEALRLFKWSRVIIQN